MATASPITCFLTEPLFALFLLFAIAGYFVYRDFLWVFNKIPYASLEHTYGSGPLFHFIFQRSLRENLPYTPEEYLLIVFGFAAFLFAHSLFWYLSIFNSMGLKRVLLGILPLICLIALRGFNFITDAFPANRNRIKVLMGSLVVLYVVIFPFTSNPAAIHWNKEMNLTKGQELAKAAAAFIQDNPVRKGAKLIYKVPYLSEVLDLDHFDGQRRIDLSEGCLSSLQKDDRIVWDSWFAPVETIASFSGNFTRVAYRPRVG